MTTRDEQRENFVNAVNEEAEQMGLCSPDQDTKQLISDYWVSRDGEADPDDCIRYLQRRSAAGKLGREVGNHISHLAAAIGATDTVEGTQLLSELLGTLSRFAICKAKWIAAKAAGDTEEVEDQKRHFIRLDGRLDDALALLDTGQPATDKK